jgi:uncharacterized protein YwgA
MIDSNWWLRLAVLATLVRKSPEALGRTALMKFAYLLQTVKGVPLGYRFELYNYGPYDSTVLGDLSQAETLKAIKSEIVTFPQGYGYRFSTNDKGFATICGKVADRLAKHEKDIEWVLGEFGHESASRLELLSTIVFAEREMRRKQQTPDGAELGRRVKRIKPHFGDETIEVAVEELSGKGLIVVAARSLGAGMK